MEAQETLFDFETRDSELSRESIDIERIKSLRDYCRYQEALFGRLPLMVLGSGISAGRVPFLHEMASYLVKALERREKLQLEIKKELLNKEEKLRKSELPGEKLLSFSQSCKKMNPRSAKYGKTSQISSSSEVYLGRIRMGNIKACLKRNLRKHIGESVIFSRKIGASF